MLNWENTWKDIEDSGTSVAVVPIAATEQHGTNLPLGSDCLETQELAGALARALGAYLVSFLPIGTSATHLSFRGTVTLKHETLKAVVSDIVDSLVKTGFKTIILVSLHWGNYILWSDFVPELSRQYRDTTVLTADYDHAWAEACKAAEFATVGLHADEIEASIIASLRPDLVGPDPQDLPDPKEKVKGVRVTHTGFPVDVREVSASGSLGEPSRGSREKGDVFWSVFLRLAVEDVKKQAGL